jgi:hypothetical protein
VEDTHCRRMGRQLDKALSGYNQPMRFLKRTRKTFVVALSIVLVLAVAGYFYRCKVARVPEEVAPGEIVGSFSFERAGDLSRWDDKKLSRYATRYELLKDDGKPCVRALSENSASALYFKERLLFKRRPRVSWDWKVVKFPDRSKPEKLKDKEEFDFAMQFYVVFHARSMLSSKAIQYVWTSDVAVGTVSDSPYTGNVKLLVLESGEQGVWKSEERDIAADYLELFGEQLEKDVVAVSFMTDSDSTGSTAEAFITNIELGYMPEIENTASDGTDKGVEAPRLPRIRSLK